MNADMDIAKTVKTDVPTPAPRHNRDRALIASATLLFVSSMACWCAILFLADLV